MIIENNKKIGERDCEDCRYFKDQEKETHCAKCPLVKSIKKKS